MSFMKTCLAFLVILTITGCATPYQKVTMMTITGGYYDKELPNGEYKVGFGGNGYTSTTTAMDYALLRCSELTLEKGKKYFEIVQGAGGRQDDAYWTGYGIAYSSKPSAEYIIRLHDVEPEKPDGKVFNAVETKELVKKRNSLDENNNVGKGS